MQSIKSKVYIGSVEQGSKNLEENRKYIETYGFEAWLKAVELSHLIPTYRKTHGMPPIESDIKTNDSL